MKQFRTTALITSIIAVVQAVYFTTANESLCVAPNNLSFLQVVAAVNHSHWSTEASSLESSLPVVQKQSQQKKQDKEKLDLEIVMQVTREIADYGVWSVSINGKFAQRHGYGLIVEVEMLDRNLRDNRFGKVKLLHDAIVRGITAEMSNSSRSLSSATLDQSRWVLWLDADVFILNSTGRWPDQLVHNYGGPAVDVIIARESDLSNGQFNTGVVLMRVSDWSMRFLDAWWDAPEAKHHAADQIVLDALWAADKMGVRTNGHFAVVPNSVMNSANDWYEAFTPEQPLLHLMSNPPQSRVAVGKAVLQSACSALQNDPPTTARAEMTWLYQAWVEGLHKAASAPNGFTDAMDALRLLASFFSFRGAHEQALNFALRSLELAKKLSLEQNGGNPKLARAYANLAIPLNALGSTAEAAKATRSALAIWEALQADVESTGGSKWDIRTAAGFGIASTAFNLAALLVDGGDFSGEPEKLYQRAIKQWIAMPGSGNNPSVASGYNNLAILYFRRGEFAEAKHYMTQALELRKIGLGAAHPDTKSSEKSLEIIAKKRQQKEKQKKQRKTNRPDL